MMTFPTYGKIKNVPTHQPGIIYHYVIWHDMTWLYTYHFVTTLFEHHSRILT
jgi:hypothetical protein